MTEQLPPKASLNSKIKSIYLGLPDYHFSHNPNPDNYNYYISREQSLKRLQMLLDHPEHCESGTYLVAGYRGMGKTSLVHRAIKSVNKEGKKYLPIHISLSQDDIRDFDVLKSMASQLNLEWLKNLDVDQLFLESRQVPTRISLEEITQRLEYLSDRINAVVKVQDFSARLDQVSIMQNGGKLSNEFRENHQTRGGHHQEMLRGEYLSKEVERELLQILELMSTLREEQIRQKKTDNIPYIVFVLDELDKIEPNYFYQEDFRKSAPLEQEMDNVFGANRIRRRQELVSKLLANLKSFLSTAPAKFIFIGGREMYDASLADIADRDSFYSSIFHDVIYINSFFKDKFSTVKAGLTRLTEAYLCKLLIPFDYAKSYVHAQLNNTSLVTALRTEPKDEDYCLSMLFQYLIDWKLGSTNNSGTGIHQLHTSEDQAQIYKLLFFLQNFIIFLAYRSNGTPKKMVDLLESYIEELDEAQLQAVQTNYLTLVQKMGEESDPPHLFLKFDYRSQYEIGLSSNIYRPYIIIYSSHLKVLEDKLLYSTSYIVDYLFKFHANAFSWRNLELIPEIILSNKDPNLRYYITELLYFLSNAYVRETVTGVFQYKFFNKAAQEISFLTKISETASAAFSFTLDESQHIIRYYRRKLAQLRDAHPHYQRDFVYAVAFVEGLLGDIHYFEKEYDEAIIMYTNSTQALNQKLERNSPRLSYEEIVLYLKNKLHLALSHEKIKAYDSAYAIYRSLILSMDKLLNLTLENPGKKHPKENKTPKDPFIWDKPIRRVHLFIKPFIALLDLLEKQRGDGFNYANLLRAYEEFSTFILRVNKKPHGIGQEKIKGLPKRRTDSIRVAFLYSDYYHSLGSILFYKNRNFPELLHTLHEHTWLKKTNRKLDTLIQTLGQDFVHYTPCLSSFTYYLLALQRMVNVYEVEAKPDEELQFIHKKAAKGVRVFIQLIRLLQPGCKGVIGNNLLVLFGNMITRIADALLASLNLDMMRQNPLNAGVIALFSETNFDESNGGQVEKNLDKITRLFVSLSPHKCLLDNLFNLNHILILYRLAALYYFKAGKMYRYSFQYRKFLFVLNDYLSYVKDVAEPLSPAPDTKIDLSSLYEAVDKIAVRIFNANTWMTNVSNRPQISKYYEIFKNQQLRFDANETRLVYSNLSNNPEIKETIIAVESIKLKLDVRLNRKTKLRHTFVTPYDLISNRYSRIHELKFQTDLNFNNLDRLGVAKLLITSELLNLKLIVPNLCQEGVYPQLVADLENKDAFLAKLQKQAPVALKLKLDQLASWIKDKTLQELRMERQGLFLDQDAAMKVLKFEVFQIIQDSIFALFEIIRSLNIFGINYACNHSFLANMHARLADWCTMAMNYALIDQLAQGNNWGQAPCCINSELRASLGDDNIHYLDPEYHCELAIQHYHAALQMHNGGSVYKKINQSMSFLEDDFNDNLYHFIAALERLRINTGAIDQQLKLLKEKMKYSLLYEYGNYVGLGK